MDGRGGMGGEVMGMGVEGWEGEEEVRDGSGGEWGKVRGGRGCEGREEKRRVGLKRKYQTMREHMDIVQHSVYTPIYSMCIPLHSMCMPLYSVYTPVYPCIPLYTPV